MTDAERFDIAAEDNEDTVLGSRRIGPAAADNTEDTIIGSRRAVEPDDDTIIGSRRAVEPDDDTVIGSRRAVESDDDTIIGGRRPLGLVPHAAPPPSNTAALDSTVRQLPRATPRRAESDDGAFPDVVPDTEQTQRVNPARRSAAAGGAVADHMPRRAETPEPAILKAPYRPREISTVPVVRQPLVPRNPEAPERAVAAHRQQARRSSRMLTAVVVTSTVIVIGALAGIAWLVLSFFLA